MEVMLGVEILVAVVVVAVAWPVWRYWERRGRWAPEGSKQLPGSMGFPLLGETLELLASMKAGDPEAFRMKRFGKHGNVFKSHIFGSPYVFFRGAEAAKLLVTGEEKLVQAHQFPPVSKILGEESMLNVHGPRHKLYRKMLNETFLAESIRKYLPLVEQTALETLSSWKLDDVLVTKHEAIKFTYHVIARVVLSWGPGPVRDRSLELTEIVSNNLLQAPIDLPGFAFNKAMQSRRELLRMFDTEFALRRSGKIVRSDVLSEMMNAVDPDSSSDKPAMNDEQLRDTLFSIIMAGFETTSTTITWIVKLLHENPSVKDKLLAEHLAVRSKKQAGEPLTWADLGQPMTYTLKVINEALRVSSIVFWWHRKVKEDFTFNGYHIPKGWNLMLDTHNLHHSPEIFQDPETFNPSRFDVPTKPFTLLAFGGGQRLCLGKELALMEMKVMLHHMMLKFRWTVEKPDSGRDLSGLPCPNNGVPIRIQATHQYQSAQSQPTTNIV